VGAVLSTVLGPLLLLLAVGSLRLLSNLGIARGTLRAALHAIEAWVQRGVDAAQRAANIIGNADGVLDGLAALPAAGRATYLLLPGMVAAMLLWAALARFRRRHAATVAATAMNARELRPDDLEERQMGNIIAEMALAAGLPVPRVLLVDVPQVNAGAFGASHQDATVVVTRGLLDTLDRRETQGVAAHLIGATGNGDLWLAAAVQAVFGTLGALLTLFDLPFRRSAWTALGDLARVLTGRVTGAEAAAVSDGLTASVTPESSEAMLKMMSVVDRWPPLGALLVAPLMPWMLLTMMQKFIVQMWMLFLFGWPLAWLWRTRRFLADATAVQLTRDPDALTGATEGQCGSGFSARRDGAGAWLFPRSEQPSDWAARAPDDCSAFHATYQRSTQSPHRSGRERPALCQLFL
jgi:Zn-dependent protease with chaperone function